MFRWAGMRAWMAIGCLGFAACSGGSHASPVAPVSIAQTAAAAATAFVSFTIPAPVASAGSVRRAAYVSPATSTLLYTATNGSSTLGGTIATLSSYCTASGASRACTVPISAPTGSDTITVSLYNGAALLSTHTTASPVTIAEGSANVIPPMILDPIPISITVSYSGTPGATATASTVTLNVKDGTGQPIAGLGTYVSGTSDAAVPLTLTANSTAAGSFSSNGCSSQATSFTPWTTTSALSLCSTSAMTLGTLYTAAFGSVTAPFSARRTNVTGTALTTGASSSVNYQGAQWISGADGLSVLALPVAPTVRGMRTSAITPGSRGRNAPAPDRRSS
jgi:hypothetical protein